MPFEPGPVVAEIVTSRTNHQWSLAQQRQVIGDIPGDSTAHFAHRVDQKADGKHMRLLGQHMIPEVTGEVHDVVKRERAGHNNPHDSHSFGLVGYGSMVAVPIVPQLG